MKIAIDISQIAYEGTGVANYMRNLVIALVKNDKKNDYLFFGYSLRKKHLIDKFLTDIKSFNSRLDIRSFPLLCLIFFVFGLILAPAGNAFSRLAERQADQFALDATGDKISFISAMQELSDQNLADPDPNPIIEFLLYDHPAIGKRIQMAERYAR